MTERGSSNKIREQMRKESVDDRQLHRQLAVNQARKNLGETAEELQVLNVTTQAKFTDILAKLKKRNNTSHLDLRSLKQGLQDPANSKVFLRSTGALPAVIGHLTGKKALHQLEAAYICCNLATGEDFQCVSVANAAGPYLIEFLNGPNTALHVASIWTLGNLAGGSSKSRNILLSQGLLPRLLSCLKSPLPEVVEASLNAFILILKSTINEKQSSRFTSETSQQIATIVLQLPCCRVEVAWLIFLLSCTPECDNLLNGQNELDSFISKLSEVSRNSPLKVEDLSTLRFITAIVRTLANLSSAEDGEAALRILAHPMLPMILNDFLHASHTHLRLETEWLTANLLSHPSGVVAKQSQAIKLDAVLNAKGNDHSKIELIISGV